jgi:hypothetical protein
MEITAKDESLEVNISQIKQLEPLYKRLKAQYNEYN